MIGYYYKSFVNSDLGGLKQLMTTYGEGEISVTVEQFSK